MEIVISLAVQHYLLAEHCVMWSCC